MGSSPIIPILYLNIMERWQSWSIVIDLKSIEFKKFRGFKSHSFLINSKGIEPLLKI